MAADRLGEDDEDVRAGAGRRRRFGSAESESDTYGDFIDDGEDGPAGRFRLFRVLIAGVALIAFAAVTWYAYNWGIASREPQELVVIQAEATPEKERPTEEGGLKVPHRDKLLLNETAPDSPQPKIERLLPPPETPKPPSLAEPAATAPLAAEDSQGPDVERVGGERVDSETAVGEAAEEAPLLGAEPKVAGLPESTADRSETARSLVVREAESPKFDQSGGESQAVLDDTVAEAPPTPPTKPQAPKVPAAPKVNEQSAAVPAATDGYFLQMASVKSRAAAAKEWARLQKQFTALLGSQSLTVEQAVVKGTEYHRVQTGNFARRDDAAALCAQLKAGGQDCLVRKR